MVCCFPFVFGFFSFLCTSANRLCDILDSVVRYPYVALRLLAGLFTFSAGFKMLCYLCKITRDNSAPEGNFVFHSFGGYFNFFRFTHQNKTNLPNFVY